MSALYLRKRWYWLALIGLPLLLLLAVNLPPWVVVIASVIIGLLAWAAYCSWRLLGVAVNKEHLILRRGLIGRSYVVVPLAKIQRINFVQTHLMRRRGCAPAIGAGLKNCHHTLPFGTYGTAGCGLRPVFG